ncbi:hypothetical protein Dsin_015832 [Dipteronia sinensis]|uniref:Reverse transcriptase domain-containing protein n=1 Tax=Dipteronia sinensis TaxID=43782 RepID=A0AAE0ACJ4_9ROSI|nr:hypothetical protein Dsin_015832 [Dipteronia sinensis]
MKDFRPISLMGSMYKVLSKVMANRLRNMISLVVGESQMALVKNRQILDGFIIAEEIIHKWKHDKQGGILVKLDFEKAYDCVDHTFLDQMMEIMGFGEKWRRWMWNCISSPKLSVLVNGIPTKQFVIERSLRQGDPLSHFLFNIVIEGLSALFRTSFALNLTRGVIFGKESIHIFHLQFTDNTMLFLLPKVDYLLNARRILRCELVSGLRINFYKTCVARISCRGREETNWAAIFRSVEMSLQITYLGLPLG